jgi:hypothetical protein
MDCYDAKWCPDSGCEVCDYWINQHSGWRFVGMKIRQFFVRLWRRDLGAGRVRYDPPVYATHEDALPGRDAVRARRRVRGRRARRLPEDVGGGRPGERRKERVMSGPFGIGDQVAWTSQSAGIAKHKTGGVVQVVPPGGYPVGVRNPGMARDHLSYVVRVKYRGLYWPRVGHLRWADAPAPRSPGTAAGHRNPGEEGGQP